MAIRSMLEAMISHASQQATGSVPCLYSGANCGLDGNLITRISAGMQQMRVQQAITGNGLPS
jgi:hypothetical protein